MEAKQSRGGTVETGKYEFSVEELIEIFPDAQLGTVDGVQPSSEAVPDAFKQDSKPVQAFVHEFECGRKIHLNVYSDRSGEVYGWTPGSTSTSGSTTTWTDSVVYWYIFIAIKTHNLEYYVTHSRTGGTGNIISHRLKDAYPVTQMNQVEGGNGQTWIRYNALLASIPGSTTTIGVGLHFNASSQVVSATW
jgi:hypothetical protein